MLRAPDVPSVLIELGFVSSQQDLKMLTSQEWSASAPRARLLRRWMGFSQGAKFKLCCFWLKPKSPKSASENEADGFEGGAVYQVVRISAAFTGNIRLTECFIWKKLSQTFYSLRN